MRPLRNRLQESWRQRALPSYVIERDYLLSWVLAGISAAPELRETLVFKGGTALKKCYFGEYRFSEDLDFSAREGVPVGDAMAGFMVEACATAQRLLDDYAPIEIRCERYAENHPHPGGQEAFQIRARFPWHRNVDTPVRVEVTMDERILWPVAQLEVNHGYGELLEAGLAVYSLEEVVAEKLRAILQQLAQLESRGWMRNRARDYYDLWRVLRTYRDDLDLTDFRARLHEKCRLRDVDFDGAEDFFDPRMVSNVGQGWRQSLGPLVSDLPDFGVLIDELRSQVAVLL